MEPAAGLLVLALAGAAIGALTGLLPALHVNTLALVLVASVPLISPWFVALGLVQYDPAFYAAAAVLAVSISHTFVNIIPAAYLGAPDESSGVHVLPAHRMLLRGQGYRAVRISAFSSFFALVVALALIVPFRWAMAEPFGLFALIRAWLPWLVPGLALLLVLGEPHGLGPSDWGPRWRRAMARLAALSVFLGAGLYGLIAFRLDLSGPLPIPASPLLPALSGLFGAATILTSAFGAARIPHQFLRMPDTDLRPAAAVGGVAVGVAAGAAMSVFPGLTSASATGMVAAVQRGGDAQTLVSLSSVNTANALFNLAMLYLFLKTRSGAVVAIEAVLPVVVWDARLPRGLALLLFVALAAGVASLVLTLVIGRLLVRRLQKIPYRGLLSVVLLWMLAVVAAFTGIQGLLLLVVATAIGLVPVRLGIRRVALTGVLLVPVVTYLWT